MSAQISLVVGSDETGWAEIGDDAVLGAMTKAMPGGDGSLDWALYGDAAWKHRNLLVPGAKVRLRINGEPQWSGRLASDAIRHRLSTQDTVICAAAGLNSWLARHQAFAIPFVDRDTSRWIRTGQRYDTGTAELVSLEDAWKFETDNDGRLLIKAASDRTYDDSANSRLAYWLFDGLANGFLIVGLAFDYKCYLPEYWDFTLLSCEHPWVDNSEHYQEFIKTADEASWLTNQYVDLDAPNTCLILRLRWNSGSSDTGNAAYVWMKNVKVRFRMAGVSVDTSVSLYDAMTDVASLDGFATAVEASDGTLTTVPASLVYEPEWPRTAADTLRLLSELHTSYVEYAFYLNGAGEDAFYCCAKPANVNAARNCVWSYGQQAGEDADQLQRDAETSPDYVVLTHKSLAVADLPDGRVRRSWYPSQPTGFDCNVLPITDYADMSLTDTEAGYWSQLAWQQLQAAQWTGSVPFADELLAANGNRRPSWYVRPGDRISVPSLAGASDLYVADTAFDFRTMGGSMTIGPPWTNLRLGSKWTPRRSLWLPGGPRGGTHRLRSHR